jgi:DNA-binding NarL/FixJ family response regulator
MDRLEAPKVLIVSPHKAVLAGLRATITTDDNALRSQPRVITPTSLEQPDQSQSRWADVVVWHAHRQWLGAGAILDHTDKTPVLGVVDDADVDGIGVFRMLRRGFIGIVSMTNDLSALPEACREATDCRPYLSRSLVEMAVKHLNGAADHAANGNFGLTLRESQVLRLLSEGRSQRGIAESLAIKERTVRHHLERSYRKLGVRNRAEAVAVAYQEGLAP